MIRHVFLILIYLNLQKTQLGLGVISINLLNTTVIMTYGNIISLTVLSPYRGETSWGRNVLVAKRPGGETSKGETSSEGAKRPVKGRNVQGAKRPVTFHPYMNLRVV